MHTRLNTLLGLLLSVLLLTACAQAPEQSERDHILDGKDDAFDRLDRHTR